MVYVHADLKEKLLSVSMRVNVYILREGVREKERKDGKNVQFRTFNYFLHLRSLVRQNKFLIVSIASNSGMSHGMIDRNSDVKSRGVSLVFEFTGTR